MMQYPGRLLLLAMGLLSSISIPVAGRERDGFMTNLAILDELTQQAVSEVLDSLSFKPGESVTIVASGGSEANEFVAQAFARTLARQGCEVKLALESTAPPPAPVAPPPHPEPKEVTPPGGSPGDTTGVKPAQPPAGGEGSTPAGGTGGGDGSERVAPTGIGDSLLAMVVGVGVGASEGASGDSLGGGSRPDSLGGAPAQPAVGEGSGTGTSKEESPVAPATPASPIPAPTWKLYPEGTVLEFRVLEFGVNYPTVKRRFAFFGGTSVRRLAGVYIEASRIEGPEGRIIDVATGQSHSHDQLSPRARILAEGANYPFTKPVIPPTNLSRLIEPILVVGIVSGLVYLFYQNQK